MIVALHWSENEISWGLIDKNVIRFILELKIIFDIVLLFDLEKVDIKKETILLMKSTWKDWVMQLVQNTDFGLLIPHK